MTQRVNKFKQEGIRKWATPVYEHFQEVLDVKRKKAVAFEYALAQDRCDHLLQDFLDFDEFDFD